MGWQYITEILHFHDKQFRRHRAEKKPPDSLLMESPESTRMSLQPQSTHCVLNDVGGQRDVTIFKHYALASLRQHQFDKFTLQRR